MAHQMVLFRDRLHGICSEHHYALSGTRRAILDLYELYCERKNFLMSVSFHVALMQDDELSSN